MRTSWCWGAAAILFADPAGAAACWLRPSSRSRCVVACCVVTAALAGPAAAEEPVRKSDAAGKIIHETWDAAFLQGQKTGYYHTTVREFSRDGQTLRRVTQELNMTVKRGGAVNVIRAESGDDETADGKVVGVFLK